MECYVCGMTMTKPDDFANGDTHSNYCVYCASEQKIKSGGTVRESIIQFWLSRYESVSNHESEPIST
ncbi:MAG: hypothetical protein BAJATHORv1_90055 [Candidatus Thorarchaeota archaeon]|nr:MAG: hypothetical protein BAJATHORv1_90055 [Candidatus Thorarchaeota archaeon]